MRINGCSDNAWKSHKVAKIVLLAKNFVGLRFVAPLQERYLIVFDQAFINIRF